MIIEGCNIKLINVKAAYKALPRNLSRIFKFRFYLDSGFIEVYLSLV
jgi:hypothetical protein